MKLLYALFLSLALTCCGSRTKTPATDSADTMTMAATALKGIYDDVFSWYNEDAKGKGTTDSVPDFDALYMSRDYKAVLQKVAEKDRKMEKEGFVGFFDYDHWVCGQDYGNLSMRIISVSEERSGKCRAEVEISNLGTKTRLGVVLVKENGDWKIDDFIDEGTSEKNRMRDYAAGK
jgi:squalene cyclase